jgi:hypothetical protein
MKCLILIISSQGEHYNKLENLWRKYINKNDNFHYLFLKSDNKINDPIIIKDVLYVNGRESTIPGVLIKTIKAFKFFEDYYDFIFRTNLSSFLILNRFEKFLKKVDENYVYAVIGIYNNILFPSGSGFLISKKILKMLNKCDILSDNDANIYNDDVIIGKYLKMLNIDIKNPGRYDTKIDDDLNISENIYHIRNKIEEERGLEIEIYEKLISKYYN